MDSAGAIPPTRFEQIIAKVDAQKGWLGTRVVTCVKANPIKSAFAVLAVVGTVAAAVLKGAAIIAFACTPWGIAAAAVIFVVAIAILFAYKYTQAQAHKALVQEIIMGIRENKDLVDPQDSQDLRLVLSEFITAEGNQEFVDYYGERVKEHMKTWPSQKEALEPGMWSRIIKEFVSDYRAFQKGPESQ